MKQVQKKKMLSVFEKLNFQIIFSFFIFLCISNAFSSSISCQKQIIMLAPGTDTASTASIIRTYSGLDETQSISLLSQMPALIGSSSDETTIASVKSQLEALNSVLFVANSCSSSADSCAQYDLILETVVSKVNAIKAVRSASGLGIRESMDATNNLPFTVLSDVTSAEANAGAAIFTSYGETTTIVESCE